MKTLAISIFFIIGLQHCFSQANCDTVLYTCDSITIDSVWFVDDIVYGDKLIFFLKTEHVWHYAPAYIICPDDESILFEDNSYDFTSMYGPAEFQLLYYFTEFDITDLPEITGRIINDNANNAFPFCAIPFHVIIDGVDAITTLQHRDDIVLFPNPTTQTVHIKTMHASNTIKHVIVYDMFGNGTLLQGDNSTYNISQLQQGIYFLRIQLRDEFVVFKKLIVL